MNNKSLIVDPHHTCWSIDGLKYLEFSSDPLSVRKYARQIAKEIINANVVKEHKLIEQQISEIIKNAIYHGNKKDKSKIVKIFYGYTPCIKLIVEDEGEGFIDLEDWNRFNQKRNEAIENNDIEKIMKYVSYRSPHTFESEGGNSLFASLEYWNIGIVYSAKRNKVCMMRQVEEKGNGSDLS